MIVPPRVRFLLDERKYTQEISIGNRINFQ